jgi:formate dehydrogenase major subunit
MAEICGIDAETSCATWRAPSPGRGRAMIFWGMGVSQHIHGTDNSRCLISLALMCGQVGRPGTGCTRCAGRTTCRARRTPG